MNWWIDDYVALSVEQQEAFDAGLFSVLQWHRYDELPRYKTIIEESLIALEGGVTLADAELIADDIDQAVVRLQEQMLELLLDVGDSLSDQQITEFLSTIDEDQTTYREKRLSRSDDEYFEDSADSLEDLAKRLLGRLTRDQKQLIASTSRELTRLDGLWHADREKWGASLRAILEQRSGDWRGAIVALVEDREAERIPDYVAAIDRNGEIILALLVDVINSRSERQDRRLRGFLTDLAEDIDALSARIEPTIDEA
ncbi:MAG: DUF6279 family lipoprotein [Luminiphilus sp.]